MKTIAIDVGGTKIKYALYDGSLKNFESMPTPKNRKDFLLAILKIAALYPDVNQIGIGLPGIIEKSGKILNLPNLNFLNNFNIIEYFSKPGFDVRIDNDVKCYLRAEIKKGLGKKHKDFVLLSIGTGIGGGIVVSGKIYSGQGSAGELGHMIIDSGKDLSFYAAGKTLKKFDKKEMQRVSKYLGYALINIINIFDPEAVLLSGGLVTNHLKEFLPAALKYARANLISSKAKTTPVLKSELGEQAGVLGAGLLFGPGSGKIKA
ncbi:MAG: hypothetical protein JWO40_373 [Candidatus Doudnabacteria bacterium]|nr:hypothetical protein [Candidatus Doudnabacteria bacterium]